MSESQSESRAIACWCTEIKIIHDKQKLSHIESGSQVGIAVITTYAFQLYDLNLIPRLWVMRICWSQLDSKDTYSADIILIKQTK